MLSQAAVSSSILFIPNLAQDLGADDTYVGIIGAVYGLALFSSSYVFGRESDIYDRRLVIRIGLGLSVVTFIMQVLADPYFFAPVLTDPLSLALVRFAAGLTAGMSPAALAAYVYDSRDPLGRFSAFGALGYAIGALVAGFVAVYWGVFVVSSLCFLVAFAISFRMTPSKTTRLKVSLFPVALMKKNWYVYSAFLSRHIGANAIWIIYPLFIVSIGGDKLWIGIIYAVNSLSQFFIMLVLDRFGDRRLVSAGLLLSATTFVGFSLTQSFYQLLPVQVLLASSWSCLYVGSLVYLMDHNVEKATSIGILGSVSNLATVFGSLLGGVISQFFGYVATMYAASILALIGYFLFKVGVRRASKVTTRDNR